MRRTNDPGARRERKSFRAEWSQSQLTRAERFVAGAWMVLTLVLPLSGAVVTVVSSGAVRTVGIALLLVGLVIAAVPVSPFLKARIRRRERAVVDEKGSPCAAPQVQCRPCIGLIRGAGTGCHVETRFCFVPAWTLEQKARSDASSGDRSSCSAMIERCSMSANVGDCRCREPPSCLTARMERQRPVHRQSSSLAGDAPRMLWVAVRDLRGDDDGNSHGRWVAVQVQLHNLPVFELGVADQPARVRSCGVQERSHRLVTRDRAQRTVRTVGGFLPGLEDVLDRCR